MVSPALDLRTAADMCALYVLLMILCLWDLLHQSRDL